MTKLVRLIFNGSFEQGFTVSVDITQDGRPLAGIAGRLPAEPEIPNLYSNWQSAYRKLDLNARLGSDKDQIINVSLLEDEREYGRICKEYGNNLSDRLQEWLESSAFGAVRRRLSREISAEDDVQILLQSDDPNLYCLPWHLCDLFDHPKLEFAWSSDSFQKNKHIVSGKNRILVILGSKRGINIEEDRKMLEDLPNTDIKFLVQPRREQLTEELWRQQWDMLFFAGHSLSQSGVGRIYINETESLTIGELRFALGNAVRNGLKLAVFNSCDGLGLARSLAELHIPQVIVMREPIPDAVAHIFLKYFLEYFSKGTSLYASVRQARERLESVEGNFPCASWLPIIYQNPAAVPFVWIDGGVIGRGKDLIVSALRKYKKIIVFLSIAIIAIVVAIIIVITIPVVPPIGNTKELISTGERVLNQQENKTKKKEDGTKAFANGKFDEAINLFQQHLYGDSEPGKSLKINDPEALIYLNNARVNKNISEQTISEQNQNVFVIAVSVPIAQNSNIAQEILRGAAQAQYEVNKQNNGFYLKVIVADDNNDPDTAAKIAKYFSDKQSGILAVMGHNRSEPANSAADVYREKKLVAVFPTSNNLKRGDTPDNNYIFSTVSNNDSEVAALVKYAKEKELSKIGICYDKDDRSSLSVKNEFQKQFNQFAKTDCNISNKNNFDPNRIIEDFKKENVDGLLFRPSIDKIQNAIKIAQAAQNQKLTLMATSTMYTKDTLDKSTKGMVISTIWHPEADISNKKFAKQFAGSTQELWGATVNWRTASSYDAMQVIIEGLKKIFHNNSDHTNLPELRQKLQKEIATKDFSVDGVTGKVSFRKEKAGLFSETDENIGSRNDSEEIILVEITNKINESGLSFSYRPPENKESKNK